MTAAMSPRLAILGAGQMAEALVAGLVATRVVDPARILATDPVPARREHAAKRFGIRTGTDNREAVASADVVVLAVKPQVLARVLTEAGRMGDRLVISIVAGVPIDRLRERLNEQARIVRAMPNAPVVVREGMTALSFGPGTTEEDQRMVRQWFESVGRVAVVEESLLDAVTGLSGSGPAYVCLACEALADGGVKMGLPRRTASELAMQTLYGAARTALELDAHPGELKDQVASPGGTTIAGLHHLEQAGVRAAIIAAVTAATRRAQEMGRTCLS